MNCDICEYVKKADNPIFESKYWIVFLADEQAYLGRSFVTLKRHCGDIAKLEDKEWVELLDVVGRLENAVRDAFGPSSFNWTCLMNLAYQNNPPNPHVHWHFIPRYGHEVNFAGTTFVDPEFGSHYAREKERSKKVSGKIKSRIIAAIRKRLKLPRIS